METTNNFCSSKLSRVCQDFHLLQIANLDKQRCPDFLKCEWDLRQKIWTSMCVWIWDFKKMQIWTHLRKSRRTEIVGYFHLCYKNNHLCSFASCTQPFFRALLKMNFLWLIFLLRSYMKIENDWFIRMTQCRQNIENNWFYHSIW